jgi:subtilisin family serine protease
MTTLDLVGLTTLMQRTPGNASISIGLIDGPVALRGPDLAAAAIREIPAPSSATICETSTSYTCAHGTFMASMLAAPRGGEHAAICPDCTLLVRPIFHDRRPSDSEPPVASADDLAAAIFDCIQAGARAINLSLALVQPSLTSERLLQSALDHALTRGVIIVAAAGNQRALGSTVITRHPWVIPVMACDLQGRPAAYSNFGRSIGSRGLSAPGDSPSPSGAREFQFRGTSVAAPYITGTVALLWSLFPGATAQAVKLAVTGAATRRPGIVPPLLNAASAYQLLLNRNSI